jgi:hypothetical protein
MKKDVLVRPFTDVKSRPGHGGKQLHYLETASVIERLNEASDHTFSFELVKYELLEAEVIVTGRMTLDGVVKMDVGSANITRDASGAEVSVGDDVKAAVSDCVKRCARLYGCGLHLYQQESPAVPRSAAGPPSRVEDRLTSRQLGALQAACRRKGWSSSHLTALVDERFGKNNPQALTRSEASTLISELSGTNGH